MARKKKEKDQKEVVAKNATTETSEEAAANASLEMEEVLIVSPKISPHLENARESLERHLGVPVKLEKKNNTDGREDEYELVVENYGRKEIAFYQWKSVNIKVV